MSDPLVATLTLVKASDELNLTASLQSLAAGISTFALAATVIPGGVIADRLGRRRVLAFSLLLSALGQLITAFGPDPVLFLLGRVVTGVALGTTFAAAYGMLKNVTTDANRGPSLALFSVANTIVPLLVMISAGPVAAFNWRWAYLILPVVSVVLFPLTLRMLPAVPKLATGRVDYLGMLLVAVGVAGLLLGLSAAGTGLQSPSFWAPLLIGAVALVGFAFHGSTTANPVFPPKILLHPAFLAAVLLGIIFNFSSGGSSQMAANFWQYVVRMPTAVIGIASAPIAVVSVIAAVIAGRLIKAGKPAGVIALSGCSLIVLGLGSLGFMNADSGYLAFLPMMALSGFGVATVALVQGNLFLNLAPARFFGPVTSSKTAVGQFGYSLGLSGTTVLVSMFTLNGVEKASHGAVSGDAAWDSITSYLATGTTTDANLLAIGRPALSAIYAQAFSWTALISAALVALLAVVIAWSLRRQKAKIPMDEFLGLAPLEPAPNTES